MCTWVITELSAHVSIHLALLIRAQSPRDKGFLPSYSRLTGVQAIRRVAGMQSRRLSSATTCVAILAAALPVHVWAELSSGSYTGDGASNRAISVGFAPDFVFIKGDGFVNAYARTSTMAGDRSKDVGCTNCPVTTGRIVSFSSTGFSVGSETTVNGTGTRYQYIAWRSVAGQMVVGTYTGTGAQLDVVAGLTPAWVIIFPEDGPPPSLMNSSMSLTTTVSFVSSNFSSGILSLSTPVNGFRVGTSNRVNAVGVRYHYVVFAAVPGVFSVGSYSGNGVNGRSVSLAFEPAVVFLRGTSPVRYRSAAFGAGDVSTTVSLAFDADGIQSLDLAGFTVGTDSTVNSAGNTYTWMAFAAATGGSSPNGTSCSSGSSCGSGLCVDGVCCDTACGGGSSTDCQACSVAAGSGLNGTCQNRSSGSVCRTSAGICDIAESCTGVTPECPSDAFVPASEVCRAAVDDCDAAETCEGASASCPPDELRASGAVCREALGPCDVAERCTGSVAACPADGLVTNTSVCTDACGQQGACAEGICIISGGGSCTITPEPRRVREYVLGCGCSSSEGALVFLCLSLLVRARRGR